MMSTIVQTAFHSPYLREGRMVRYLPIETPKRPQTTPRAVLKQRNAMNRSNFPKSSKKHHDQLV